MAATVGLAGPAMLPVGFLGVSMDEGVMVATAAMVAMVATVATEPSLETVDPVGMGVAAGMEDWSE